MDITQRLRRWTISTDAVPASDLMDEAADEIERLRSLVPQWISVTERLPDNSESILLHLDFRDGYGGQAVGYFIGGQFWLYEGDNITCENADVDATHWMPLPEPPEVT